MQVETLSLTDLGWTGPLPPYLVAPILTSVRSSCARHTHLPAGAEPVPVQLNVSNTALQMTTMNARGRAPMRLLLLLGSAEHLQQTGALPCAGEWLPEWLTFKMPDSNGTHDTSYADYVLDPVVQASPL